MKTADSVPHSRAACPGFGRNFFRGVVFRTMTVNESIGKYRLDDLWRVRLSNVAVHAPHPAWPSVLYRPKGELGAHLDRCGIRRFFICIWIDSVRPAGSPFAGSSRREGSRPSRIFAKELLRHARFSKPQRRLASFVHPGKRNPGTISPFGFAPLAIWP